MNVLPLEIRRLSIDDDRNIEDTLCTFVSDLSQRTISIASAMFEVF